MTVDQETSYHGSSKNGRGRRPKSSGRPGHDDGGLLARLRELVLGEGYAPGTALSEVRLAELFDVSRTPVREALKQLQVEGLVEIRPKVGTFVRKISRREIVEMFEVKEALEGLAARLMARRGHVPELEVLEANLERSREAIQRGDAEAYAALVHEFHHAIVTGSDNHKLAEHYTSLMNQLAYHRMVLGSVQHPGRLGRSCAEHRRIVDLIKEKDGVGAELAMRDHVAASAREVMSDSAVVRDPPQGPS
jgi:DNA-binding GntR family transcriptional regulator